METLLSEDLRDEHFHDASEHGLVWLLLNKMLHTIVFVFALFGMIRFKVKFIHTVKLVKFISALNIVHSWYMTIKFILMTLLFYLFYSELEIHKPIRQLEGLINNKKVTVEYFDETDAYLPFKLYLIEALDNVGGPYKLLGNRATLTYGFLAISTLLMLAIFPIELIYLDIGFNYIRFVLNDVSCLKELYANKQRHLDRLNSWSRTKNTSMLTLSMKKTTNYRKSRCRELTSVAPTTDNKKDLLRRRQIGATKHNDTSTGGLSYNPLTDGQFSLMDLSFDGANGTGSDDSSTSFALTASAPGSPLLSPVVVGTGMISNHSLFPPLDPTNTIQLQDAIDKTLTPSKHQYNLSESYQPKGSSRPLRPLRHSWNIRHTDDLSYSVAVANRNLKKFKPHVRSETWFKSSMVVYPIFVFFYFLSVSTVFCINSILFSKTLHEVSNHCARQRGDPTFNLCDDLSLFDTLTYYETHYCVFTISCASSFYCSYYFGTIIELYGWIQEISQQLTLSRTVLDLTRDDTITRFFGHRQSSIVSALVIAKNLPVNGRDGRGKETRISIESFDQFGGIENLWFHLKFNFFKRQSERFRCQELMALQLITKKQTLLRATYINMNLFFDELNDTRFMTQTILSRTTQISFGFALVVAITRSQFESDTKDIHFVMGVCLFILNLYLVCAACINNNINKLLPKIHSLICASTLAETDHDLLEFWLRHIQAYGVDNDAMSYRILGYKVTWRSILNFDGAVTSAYLFTIYN